MKTKIKQILFVVAMLSYVLGVFYLSYYHFFNQFKAHAKGFRNHNNK
jgi:hypothetical protein